jgi:hypothetical protein
MSFYKILDGAKAVMLFSKKKAPIGALVALLLIGYRCWFLASILIVA